MKAAVFYQPKQPLSVEELDLQEPKAEEVLVRVAAAGVCHSDLHFVDGLLPHPVPAVLGHEGAGVVEAVGEGVTYVQPGDHVILCFTPSCGECVYCVAGRPNLCIEGGRAAARGTLMDGTTRLSKNGRPVYHMAATACFAERTVVPEGGVVKIREDIPLDRAALISCGVMTGVGAAILTARVEVGSSVAVIGCGGVGLNVIQGAAIAGAARIIAVDILDSKLEKAAQFGATDGVNAAKEDPVAAIRRISPGGVDYAFEVIGRAETMRQAYDAARRGGMAVVVGLGPANVDVPIPASSFVQEKVLKGSSFGSARPRIDMPKLVDLYRAGKLKLDELISRRYPLERINEAMEVLRGGDVARSVIDFQNT
jgi:S-(hydroxymethyl)glutathione dehydrogenase/alcohol dehydrogenase